MFRLAFYIALAITLCIAPHLRAQTPASCFEIESIYVDACGPAEGENEMVRFRVGPSPLATANLIVDWPNNSWLGLCQNGTTSSKVATLNNGITNCGLLVEPTNGTIPAGAQVLLITSTSFSTTNNSFASLSDTLYVLFQCAGNTSGHFANAGSGARTLIMYFGSATTCGDTVTYMRNQLTGGDGARVDFTWNGIDTYHNDGCQAPYIPMTVNAGPDLSGCGSVATTITPVLNGSFTNVAWSGGTGTFTAGTYPQVDYLPGTGESGNVTLTVTATDCNGNTFSDDMVLSITPAPQPAITNSGQDTICNGTSLTLTASGGNSYSWSTGSATASTTVNNPGVYTVTVSTSCGTQSIDYEIFAGSPPVAAITNNGADTICIGTNTTLSASGGDFYVWSTGGTAASETVNQPGTYTVTVTTGCGVDSINYTVFGYPPPANTSLTANGATTFCAGDQVELTATGGNSYAWSTGATGATLTATTSGTYEVTISDACSSVTLSETVTVLPGPVAVVAGTTAICPGESATLTASGGDAYLWPNGSTASSLAVNAAGTYTVTVSNNCGSDLATITVVEEQPPTASISASGPLELCAGQTVELTANGSGNIMWSTGQTSPSIFVGAAGLVELTMSNNCGSASASVTVSVQQVEAAFTPSITTGEEPLEVQFANSSTGADQYSWFFGDASTSNAVEPTHVYNSEGTFTPMLIVTNALGCSDTAVYNRILVVGFPGLWVPSAFTPNYDGKNELFQVYGSGLTKFRCDVFDRWGGLIYSWEDIAGSWDGNLASGPAPIGVYVYRIEYKLGISAELQTKIGSFSLVR